MPCAAVGVVAIWLLGPPLGHVLFKPGSSALWPPDWWAAAGHAEPAKHARYLLAVLAGLLPAAVIFARSRREPRLRPQTIRMLTFASYAFVLAVLAAALLNQSFRIDPSQPPIPNFGVGRVVAAAMLVAAAAVALRSRRATDWLAGLVHETRTRRFVGLAIALLFLAIWLLKVIKTDRVPGDVPGWNLPWTLDDAFAVLNGRTPLVDFHPVYAKLLPYPAALALALFGTTTFVYSALMALLDGLALLAVYAVYRLVTRSSLLALALFLPFVATSDNETWTTSVGSVSPITLSAMWPMRYGGAFLLAWLTARHVDGRTPRRAWVLFFVGGFVIVNNLEFGMGAVLATAAVLLCTRPPSSARAALRLAADVAGGMLGAIAVISLFTFARAGALPNLGLLLEFPKLFTSLGWFSAPLPTVGLHWAIYATFVAAIAVAAVRLSRAAGDVLLTSMLAWSGVFGLLAGSYFVGRPDAFKLDGILSAWSFALGLMTIASVRAWWPNRRRLPALPHLLVLFGFGLSICSIARLSPPQDQIARLTKSRPNPVYRATAERFVREHTRSGETVALLVPMGYRIAYDLGLRDVTPYGFMNEIVTRSQMHTLIDAAKREGAREIFTPVPESELAGEGDAAPEQLQMLVAEGFERRASHARIIEFRKTRQPPD